MTLQPQIERIQGYPPDCLLRNLHAIHSHSPSLFEFLTGRLNSSRYQLISNENGGYAVRVVPDNGEDQCIQIPPVSVFPPPLASRYQAYNPSRNWLLVFGVDALAVERLRQMPLSEFTPLVLIEPDPAVLIAWMIARDYTPVFSLPQTGLYAGDRCADEFLCDLDGNLEPYFITCDGFFLIPGARFIQPGSLLHAFTPLAQKRFVEKTKEIRETGRRFAEFCRDPKRFRTNNVLVVEPAVTCWITLGNGLAQGFRDCKYTVEEYQTAFPPSSITARDSLRLLLAIQRLRPDFIVTLSHPSDLFVRGVDKAPIPRLIWYVDNPEFLIRTHHSPYDILFPVWKELGKALQGSGGRIAEEIPVGGMAIQTSRNSEWACEAGFVGTVHDSSAIRSQFSDELNRKIDGLLAAKRDDSHRSWDDLLNNGTIVEEELPILLESLHEMRRPGMSDRQLVKFFLFQESMRIYRVQVLCALHEFDLRIYGNADWAVLLQGTPIENAYQGRGLNTSDCYSFYASADISLSLHPTYPHSGPTLRDMDIPLCGGFVLSDISAHTDAVSDYFIPHEEIALFQGARDVAQQVRYYLERPEKRKSMAEAARRRILRDHSYAKRVQRMVYFAENPR